MHEIATKHTAMTRRPKRLSGSWCISRSDVVRDSLPTPSYPAFSSELTFARNQEAGP